MADLLEVRGVSVRFGGIQALRSVDLSVSGGESVGLVGPNGAGKTTLFDCISGRTRPDAGSIRFDGLSLHAVPAFRRARLGLARTFQRLEVFPELTVRDHLVVADRAHRGAGALWRDLLNLAAVRPDEAARVEEVMALVGLQEIAELPVAALGLGRCRLVELGRALACRPRLLLADEPSSGLDAHEALAVAEALRSVQRRQQTAVLLVEHDLDMVARVVDRVVVLDTGTVIAEGRFEDVVTEPAVQRAYLGGGQVNAGAPILELRDVTAGYAGYRALFGVSMSVPEGGIVALLGANGAGKSTLARVATGLVQASSGQVLVSGRDVTRTAAHRIARLGVAHVPEGRGVFGELDVEENLVLALRHRVARRALGEALEQAYSTFPVLAARRRQSAATLSGGEQRMLSLAGVLAAGARLVVADELSLGLAPAAVDSVYAGLRALHERGTAVLVVEQQVDRALALAEQAVVLVRGTVSWQGHPSQARAEMERLLTAGYAPPG